MHIYMYICMCIYTSMYAMYTRLHICKHTEICKAVCMHVFTDPQSDTAQPAPDVAHEWLLCNLWGKERGVLRCLLYKIRHTN